MNVEDKYLKAIEQAEMEAVAEETNEIRPPMADWFSELAMTSNNAPASKQYNYSKILACDERLKGHFRFDKYRHQVTVHGELPFGSYDQPAVIDEVIFTKLLGYLGATYGIDDEKKTRRALGEAAVANSYDSLLDKLDGLKWDETPRIETMLSILLGAEDNDYTREVAKLLMRGAVCRAYATDGVQFDIMPVLVGDQGCRKTSFCRSLALDPEYFEDNLGELGKADACRKLGGALIVEMAELASIKNTKRQETVKAFITRMHDSYRPLYVEGIVKYPRRCVFIGTTNDYEFLSGSFWDRRYLPIKCGDYEIKFDWTDKESVQYFFEQIWAEAIEWYKSDPEGIARTLTPTRAILEENKRQQDLFKAEHPWYAPIGLYLSENIGRKICAKELLVEALKLQSRDQNADLNNIKAIHDLMRNKFPDWKLIKDEQRLGEWGPQTRYYVHLDNQ